MPIFEYQCRDCNFKFEKLVKDPEVKVVCPNCQKTNNKKLVSNFSSAKPDCHSCNSHCSSCSK